MILLYDLNGEETLNEDKTIAKSTYDEKNKKWLYFVKKDKIRNKFYNPLDVLSPKLNSFNKRHNAPSYVFVKVTENIFSLYLKFLTTKSMLYLRHAEREIQ